MIIDTHNKEKEMSEEKKGIEKLEAFIDAMDDAVELGEELLKDGKVDLGDIASLPKAATVLTKVYGAAKEYKEMLAEIRDLDGEEFKKLIDVALDG